MSPRAKPRTRRHDALVAPAESPVGRGVWTDGHKSSSSSSRYLIPQCLAVLAGGTLRERVHTGGDGALVCQVPAQETTAPTNTQIHIQDE